MMPDGNVGLRRAMRGGGRRARRQQGQGTGSRSPSQDRRPLKAHIVIVYRGVCDPRRSTMCDEKYINSGKGKGSNTLVNPKLKMHVVSHRVTTKKRFDSAMTEIKTE